MPVHIHEVGHVAASREEKTQITHTLRSINLALLCYLLFLRKVLQTTKLVVLVRIGLRRDVVDVVRPVLGKVLEINGLVSTHSVRFIITVLTIIKGKSFALELIIFGALLNIINTGFWGFGELLMNIDFHWTNIAAGTTKGRGKR